MESCSYVTKKKRKGSYAFENPRGEEGSGSNRATGEGGFFQHFSDYTKVGTTRSPTARRLTRKILLLIITGGGESRNGGERIKKKSLKRISFCFGGKTFPRKNDRFPSGGLLLKIVACVVEKGTALSSHERKDNLAKGEGYQKATAAPMS